MKIDWKDCNFTGEEFVDFLLSNNLIKDNYPVTILLLQTKVISHVMDKDTYEFKKVFEDITPKVFTGGVYKCQNGWLGEIGDHFATDRKHCLFTKYCVIEI